MNGTELVDNNTFSRNIFQSNNMMDDQYNSSGVRPYSSAQLTAFAVTDALVRVIFYTAYVVGIPGNILSAIVWLRHRVASENPSPTYLAVLAINDLVAQLVDGAYYIIGCYPDYHRLCPALFWAFLFTIVLDSLLVLSFSIVRLFAIRRPLQVGAYVASCVL